jgi:hypothetical protein
VREVADQRGNVMPETLYALFGDAGGDPDWYGYCLDDPVNGVDPLGCRSGSCLAPA